MSGSAREWPWGPRIERGRQASPPSRRLDSALLARGKDQRQRRRLAIGLDVVVRERRIRIAHETRGRRGRVTRERRAILVRGGGGAERVLEVARQQVGDVRRVTKVRVHAVVLDAVILG